MNAIRDVARRRLDPITTGGLEAEAWVVARMSDHNDKRIASFISPLKTRPDEGGADALSLTRGHHRHGSKSQN